MPKNLTPRSKPLVAPHTRGLLVYGGIQGKFDVLYDGVVIDMARNNESMPFVQPEMALQSTCSG